MADQILTKGLGASVGIVSGKARVIKKLSDLPSVKDQEILVALRTSPNYVEVFSKIAGLITQQGGLTSHAAIVAREMNIPAVVGASDVMSKIKTGDLISLDGASGYVYSGVATPPAAPELKFQMPAPSEDDIDDMVKTIAAGVNESNELWPLAPGQLMPYIDADQSVDMYEKLKYLFNNGASEQTVAELFERPGAIKMFLLNTGIVGIKSANIFEGRVKTQDQIQFVNWLLKLAKILNHYDKNYIVSRNLYWSKEEANNYLGSENWKSVNSGLSKDLSELSVNLLLLNWSLYWDYFPEAGHELHGPYNASSVESGSVLIVKDYFNLSPSEIWEGATFPYNDIRLAQIYNTDEMYINFGNRLIGNNLSQHNTHYLLQVDGKDLYDREEIRKLSNLIKETADRQAGRVNNLEPLDKVRKGARISYFARKKFYSHFSEDWYPRDRVEATIKAVGPRFINDNGQPKPMSPEDKTKMWNPRNEIIP